MNKRAPEPTPEEINERHRVAVERHTELLAALNQQFDVVIDLHMQYVRAVNVREAQRRKTKRKRKAAR